MEKNTENLFELFERTIRNCEFYESCHDLLSLANEIGCLRGIAYCMETFGLCPHTAKFFYFIDIQNDLNQHYVAEKADYIEGE